MITIGHVRTMARYNRWQNQNLYGASERIADAERRKDRGAFWGSIHATLNHLLGGDQVWLYRFGAAPQPAFKTFAEMVKLHEGWEELKSARAAFDERIIAWADGLDPQWLEGDLSWHSSMSGRSLTSPRWVCVTHLFNHQTHHRGQVHCMITQCGERPGDTDLTYLE